MHKVDESYLAVTCGVGKGSACCRYVTAEMNGWVCAKLTSVKAQIDGIKPMQCACGGNPHTVTCPMKPEKVL